MSKLNKVLSVVLSVTCSIDIALRIISMFNSYKAKHKAPEIPHFDDEEEDWLSEFDDYGNKIYNFDLEDEEWDIK